ncbi:Pentatricopeptide repeat-containing protein, chloroplastic [Sesamum alatum]|uniref:Pentatricopeptide repeat-containing protein, chloroplastic n=1 Tax=Sesamum alatum TaxID=300844 RepID=A0AAE1YWI6_9LAMI|nr:Pentatricopeptide repeat-containing protein, chloroplastic [Sesamum alatum]
MSGITIRTLKLKKLVCLCRKFTSSAALLEGPAIEYGANHGKLEALQLVRNPANLRGLTFIESKAAHALLLRCGVIYSDVHAANKLLDAYTECSRMDYAFKLFEEIPLRNGVTWNLMILGCNQNSLFDDAWRVYCRMHNMGVGMDEFTYGSVLSACGALEHIARGKQIYGFVLKNGFFTNGYVRAGMINLFTRSCMVEDALRVLYDVHCEDVVHCWIFKIGLYLDPVVKASLINTYSKVGSIDLSEIEFAEAQDLKQVGVWANMISSFVHSENYEKAIILFQRMLKEGITPDKYIASSILSLIDSLTLGRQVHGYALKVGLVSEVSVGSSIFTMYSKCGDLEESLKAFEQLEWKDNVSWTSMIAGLAKHGCADKAVQMFRQMEFENSVPDGKILATILNSCSALHSLKLGRETHGFALRCGFAEQTIIDEALVNMYSKCGDPNSAKIVFQAMPFKDQVSWSSLISGFAQRGYIDEALRLFHDMLLSGMTVDAFTISLLHGALAILSTPGIGTPLHAYIIKKGIESETSIGSSLVMMYSECGSIGDCGKVFQEIKDPDLVSWTTMITSYARHGKGLEALQLFDLMKESGIEPDAVTFVGVLSACSHTGLVEEGYFHLNSMIRDYGIEPGYNHYACMVDLLGRAGRLEEAQRFIVNMPIEPDTVVWGTLLAACKVHGNHELGRLAVEKIKELQPSGAGAYVSVSNIWAEAGEWEHVLKIRGSMKETGIRKKEPGWSSI